MAINLTEAEFHHLLKGKPLRARGRVHTPGVMNATEKAYSGHLNNLKLAGEIVWFAFEAVKLRLAQKTFLTVDFFVMRAAGELEAHEVKGTTRKTNTAGNRIEAPFYEDDAIAKTKIAATMFPFRFVVVFKTRSGWVEREIPQ